MLFFLQPCPQNIIVDHWIHIRIRENKNISACHGRVKAEAGKDKCMKLVDKNKNDDRKERKAPLFKKKDKKNRGRERPKHHKARTAITIAALSLVTAAAALGIASDRITAAYNERTTFDSDTAAKIGKDKISVAEGSQTDFKKN